MRHHVHILVWKESIVGNFFKSMKSER